MRREQKERGREGGRWPKRKRTKTRRGSRGGLFSEDMRGEENLVSQGRRGSNFLSSALSLGIGKIPSRLSFEGRNEKFARKFSLFLLIENLSIEGRGSRIEERNGTFREEIIAS